MNGSGCNNCPVKPCETMNYRGSTCADQRAKYGLGDPMTNADRIRAMSDEDLAELIVKHNPMHAWNKQVRKIYFGFEDHRKDNPKRAWLEWLQQPAEGE